jgi:hypothetical protein
MFSLARAPFDLRLSNSGHTRRDALLAAGPVALYDRREFADGCPAPLTAHLAASIKLPQIVRKLTTSSTPAVQQTAKAVELNFPAINGIM